ncbi:MAG: hypothetical protein RLZZ282_854 [Verrucomicrobiota bacterium]
MVGEFAVGDSLPLAHPAVFIDFGHQDIDERVVCGHARERGDQLAALQPMRHGTSGALMGTDTAEL